MVTVRQRDGVLIRGLLPTCSYPKAVPRTVKPSDVGALRYLAGRVGAYDHTVTGSQGLTRHADPGKFSAVIHLEQPLCGATRISNVEDEEGMWIDKPELRNGPFDRDFIESVIHAGNRMMGPRQYEVTTPKPIPAQEPIVS